MKLNAFHCWENVGELFAQDLQRQMYKRNHGSAWETYALFSSDYTLCQPITSYSYLTTLKWKNEVCVVWAEFLCLSGHWQQKKTVIRRNFLPLTCLREIGSPKYPLSLHQKNISWMEYLLKYRTGGHVHYLIKCLWNIFLSFAFPM